MARKAVEKKGATSQELRARVAQAPQAPGVYRWLDAKGTVLYVGKAKNIRKRLQSYVKETPDPSIGPWKLSLLRHIADFDITVTENELEAFILETNLIKELRPKYNVLMKDDKNYVYVRVSVQETYPQVELVRRMQQDGAKYFGPFLSGYDAKRILEMLQTVFRYKACRKSLDALNKGKDPQALHAACTEHQIGQCCGLCAGALTKEEYRERIEEVLRFLRGDHARVAERLREMMRHAAAEKKYERAAEIRNTLATIQSLEQEQIVSDTAREDMDVAGCAIASGRAQVVLLRIRGGRIVEELSFALSGEAESTSEVLEQFLPQYYERTTDIPGKILLPEPIEGQEIFAEWLQKHRGKRVALIIPERGKKTRLLMMAEKNAREKVRLQFAKWEAGEGNVALALAELRDLLELPEIPQRIEGYDISHLSGTETVGSMVVMREGKPANAHYRSFTIRTLKEGEIDDYKALREVLRRRLRHLGESLTTLLRTWKDQGITLGKARKTEREKLEELIARATGTPPEDFDLRRAVVARTESAIVGCCRLRERKGGVLQFTSLWVDEEHRGEKLGHALIRTLLQGIKKGKVYVVCTPKLQEYYAILGFQPVLEAPEALQGDIGKKADRMAMMWNAREHRPDASLNARPDLLMIDGGKGQLSAAIEALRESGIEIPVIALAKREEEVFIPGRSDSLPFPKDSPAKFLLMRIRDEAHRFANRHREERLKKRSVLSALDEVPGIGPKTRELLLRKFGSVAAVREASDADLARFLTAAQVRSLREKL